MVPLVVWLFGCCCFNESMNSMMNEPTSMSLSVCMESLVCEICPRDSPKGHLNWISTVILVIYIYGVIEALSYPKRLISCNNHTTVMGDWNFARPKRPKLFPGSNQTILKWFEISKLKKTWPWCLFHFLSWAKRVHYTAQPPDPSLRNNIIHTTIKYNELVFEEHFDQDREYSNRYCGRRPCGCQS